MVALLTDAGDRILPQEVASDHAAIQLGDDAMHVGAGEVQRLGDQGHRFGRNMAECGLNIVEDRQQRPRAPFVATQDLRDRLLNSHRHPL